MPQVQTKSTDKKKELVKLENNLALIIESRRVAIQKGILPLQFRVENDSPEALVKTLSNPIIISVLEKPFIYDTINRMLTYVVRKNTIYTGVINVLEYMEKAGLSIPVKLEKIRMKKTHNNIYEFLFYIHGLEGIYRELEPFIDLLLKQRIEPSRFISRKYELYYWYKGAFHLVLAQRGDTASLLKLIEDPNLMIEGVARLLYEADIIGGSSPSSLLFAIYTESPEKEIVRSLDDKTPYELFRNAGYIRDYINTLYQVFDEVVEELTRWIDDREKASNLREYLEERRKSLKSSPLEPPYPLYDPRSRDKRILKEYVIEKLLKSNNEVFLISVNPTVIVDVTGDKPSIKAVFGTDKVVTGDMKILYTELVKHHVPMDKIIKIFERYKCLIGEESPPLAEETVFERRRGDLAIYKCLDGTYSLYHRGERLINRETLDDLLREYVRRAKEGDNRVLKTVRYMKALLKQKKYWDEFFVFVDELKLYEYDVKKTYVFKTGLSIKDKIYLLSTREALDLIRKNYTTVLELTAEEVKQGALPVYAQGISIYGLREIPSLLYEFIINNNAKLILQKELIVVLLPNYTLWINTK